MTTIDKLDFDEKLKQLLFHIGTKYESLGEKGNEADLELAASEVKKLFIAWALEAVGPDSTEFNGIPLEKLTKEVQLDPWLATNVENRLKAEIRAKLTLKPLQNKTNDGGRDGDSNITAH